MEIRTEQLSPDAKRALSEVLRILEERSCSVKLVGVVSPADFKREANRG